MAKNKLDNEHYDTVTPLRFTQQQDAELRDASAARGVTVTQLLRDNAVKGLKLSKGPAAKRVTK